ncbi:DUF4986 domain-containing protein, partial [Bacteroidota bacterium]
SHPSAYIAINRMWKAGDEVLVLLPMHTTIEHMPNVPNYIALLHGPILLGAKTGTEDLKGLVADDGRWGQIASGQRLPIDKAPIIIEDLWPLAICPHLPSSLKISYQKSQVNLCPYHTSLYSFLHQI